MNTITRLAGVGALALAVTTLLAGPAAASATAQPEHHSAAVFVQTDDPDGNTIVAYNRSVDGRLTQAGTYPTGGLGGVLAGSVFDHLASQGSLAYDRAHRQLYAVNAGSNTITVFTVNSDRLTHAHVVSSGGNFPVSVAVNGNVVYVLNARDGGSVQGYARVVHTLVRIPSWHRSLGLDPTQTPEFTHTQGQISFTPDGWKIVVTTKAKGNNVDVFTVDRFGGLSATPVVNADAAAVPFGVTFDSRGHLVVAEARTNAVATFTISGNGTLSLITRSATGQAGTCWIVGTGKLLYASNAGSASLSDYRDKGSGALTALGNTATDAGTVDAAASPDGQYLYAQAGTNGIVDEFRVNADGSLTSIGSLTVPGAAGGEGIVAG